MEVTMKALGHIRVPHVYPQSSARGTLTSNCDGQLLPFFKSIIHDDHNGSHTELTNTMGEVSLSD
jgi:hypothetical protein